MKCTLCKKKIKGDSHPRYVRNMIIKQQFYDDECYNSLGRPRPERAESYSWNKYDYKIHPEEITEFLKESNAIEGVYDADSFRQALYAWLYLSKVKELTMNDILKTHKILMLHQNLQPNEKGYFRKVPVYIGGHEGIDYIKIDETLKQLVYNINDVVQNGKRESQIFLERITKEHHVKYEKIHPFVDGNGRTGRMIMNWERLRMKLPLLIIHEGEEQMEYYKWFKD